MSALAQGRTKPLIPTLSLSPSHREQARRPNIFPSLHKTLLILSLRSLRGNLLLHLPPRGQYHLVSALLEQGLALGFVRRPGFGFRLAGTGRGGGGAGGGGVVFCEGF